jgi:hypothetical protein
MISARMGLFDHIERLDQRFRAWISAPFTRLWDRSPAFRIAGYILAWVVLLPLAVLMVLIVLSLFSPGLLERIL